MNMRKEQMQIAVLLEISENAKKNAEIIVGAEERLITDEKYNEMMLNGKQTKGRKELQFILYHFKKDEIVELVKRGWFKENNRTWNTRMKMLFNIKDNIVSGEIKPDEIMLTEETLKEIDKLYEENQGWEPKPEPERKVVEETTDTAVEEETADTADREDTEHSEISFASLDDMSETTDNDTEENNVSFEDLLNGVNDTFSDISDNTETGLSENSVVAEGEVAEVEMETEIEVEAADAEIADTVSENEVSDTDMVDTAVEGEPAVVVEPAEMTENETVSEPEVVQTKGKKKRGNRKK